MLRAIDAARTSRQTSTKQLCKDLLSTIRSRSPTAADENKPASTKHTAKTGTKKANPNQTASQGTGAHQENATNKHICTPTTAAATAPANAKPAATADAKKETKDRKRAKETDPAMARLRATVLHHEPKDTDPDEGSATAATEGIPCNRSRRGRRNAPQADGKLARMLAARQLLDEDQGSQATGQPPDS